MKNPAPEYEWRYRIRWLEKIFWGTKWIPPMMLAALIEAIRQGVTFTLLD